MSDHDSEHEEQPELDLSSDVVVTKYKGAADITNSALSTVAAAIKPGAKVGELCELGDSIISEATAKVYKGKAIEKGVAFPTCISVNSVVGHFSPQADDTLELKEGDVVKIDAGTHIDGFIAVAAHTVVVQADASAPVTGKAADVVVAANTALEVALRLMRPGKKISEVAAPLAKAVEAFGCSLVEGVLSHQMKQFVIDGNKCVLNKPTPEARAEDGEFEVNEVYAIDIVVSTGEGKAKLVDERETNVYKRALEAGYNLKMKASRAVFSEINKKFPTMPFCLRNLENKTSRFGLVECLNHGLLHPYPVLHEKHGELVAQFKATVLLMPNGSDRITHLPLQTLECDKQIEDEELKKLLQSSLKTRKAKKKPAKKAEDGAEPAAADAADG